MTEQYLRDAYPRANVIWILCDQLRAGALGYRGDPNVRTPNIDNLARGGMRFDSAVAGAPWCCPFRGSLLSGLYPNVCGVTKTPSALDPSIPTIARPLREAGYHTAWVGKWHLDGSNSRDHVVPPERRGGFDYWMGYENNNNQNEVYVHGTGQERTRRLPGYETDALTGLLLEHITGHVTQTQDKQGGYQPFFAALSMQPPHNPYVPPTDSQARYYKNPADIELMPNVPRGGKTEKQARFDLAGYYGMIESIDGNVGRIREALKEMGVDRETYIMFFSDHGDCVGAHGQWHKSSPWEEAIRIPFIVSALGGKANMNIGCAPYVLNHVDIAPTTLGLCGVDVPEEMQGYDYSRFCMNKNRPEFSRMEGEHPRPPESAYLQQIPRKMHSHTVNRPWRGVVTQDGWKYVCTPNNDWLLFDNNEDPFELANLCYNKNHQAKKEELHKILDGWIKRTGDEFPLPDIALPGKK